MTPEEKIAPVTTAAAADHPHTTVVTPARTKDQQDKSDARLKEIIARAVEKGKRPETVNDQTNTYPPKIAPYIKKPRPKGRQGNR